MKGYFLFLSILVFTFSEKAGAQSNQTVTSGATTNAVSFPGTGCIYNWVNDLPGIGLPASGTGVIPSFTAINTGNIPVTATITATLAPGFAYIANAGDSTVSVINTNTNTVVSTIPAIYSPICVSVSPDGSRAYIANAGLPGNISVINTQTNTVTATIPVGLYPNFVVVSPDGNRVYASSQDSVSVINAATNTVIAAIALTSTAGGMAVSTDGNSLYVTGENANMVWVINTTTYNIITTIPVGADPVAVAITPDGTKLYVCNYSSNMVSVISTKTNTVIASVDVGSGTFGISISPDGGRVYVGNAGISTVSVINTSTNTLAATISLGSGIFWEPYGICVSPDGSQLYVALANSNKVEVVDTKTYKVVQAIAVGLSPNSHGNFITGGSGCSAAPIIFKITVNPVGFNPVTGDVLIPNTFTPNGDGINDTWVIKNLNLYPQCTVQVYNRYGEKVYSSIGYGTPWNGNYNGSALPAGTYYYIINLQNGTNLLAGFVAIIR